MLKETETEETIVIFVAFLSLVAFQLGGGAGPLNPPWLRLWIKIVNAFVLTRLGVDRIPSFPIVV